MNERKRREMLSDAALHLVQFRDLMDATLPDDWAVSFVGFQENETGHEFQAHIADQADALNARAMLETVLALVQKDGGKINAIH